MVHSRESTHYHSALEALSGNRIRNTVLLALFSVMGSSLEVFAKTPPPLCHDLAGHKTPKGSVWLEGNEEGEVVCVVDGDTFDVRLKRTGQIVRARIWGVDCPESSANEKCAKKGAAACAAENTQGKEATRQTQALLVDRQVTLEPPYKNNGDRKLMYVRLKGAIDLGRKLVEKCLCVARYKHDKKAEYEQAATACKN